jgi:hypothetical protein
MTQISYADNRFLLVILDAIVRRPGADVSRTTPAVSLRARAIGLSVPWPSA